MPSALLGPSREDSSTRSSCSQRQRTCAHRTPPPTEDQTQRTGGIDQNTRRQRDGVRERERERERERDQYCSQSIDALERRQRPEGLREGSIETVSTQSQHAAESTTTTITHPSRTQHHGRTSIMFAVKPPLHQRQASQGRGDAAVQHVVLHVQHCSGSAAPQCSC
jgi:hypothetical protein